MPKMILDAMQGQEAGTKSGTGKGHHGYSSAEGSHHCCIQFLVVDDRQVRTRFMRNTSATSKISIH